MANREVVIDYAKIVEHIGQQMFATLTLLKQSSNDNVKKEMENISALDISDEQSFN